MNKSTDFAVIEINSKQFIVKEGEVFNVDSLSSDDEVKVLLAQMGEELLIGEPYLENVGVQITVRENKKDRKVSVRRFKSKSRYRKNKGHRQPISVIEVSKISKSSKSSIKQAETAK